MASRLQRASVHQHEHHLSTARKCSSKPHHRGHQFQPETLATHAGQMLDRETGARALPIYQTARYVFDSAEHAASLFNVRTICNVYAP
jgi:hypothetical protein